MVKDEIEKRIWLQKDKKNHESTRLIRKTHDSSHETKWPHKK